MSLWNCFEEETSGNLRFFLVSFLYIDLESYYRLNFTLMHDHKFSISEIEEFMPWERDVYLILLREWIKEEKQRIEAEKRKSSASSRPPRRR